VESSNESLRIFTNSATSVDLMFEFDAEHNAVTHYRTLLRTRKIEVYQFNARESGLARGFEMEDRCTSQKFRSHFMVRLRQQFLVVRPNFTSKNALEPK